MKKMKYYGIDDNGEFGIIIKNTTRDDWNWDIYIPHRKKDHQNYTVIFKWTYGSYEVYNFDHKIETKPYKEVYKINDKQIFETMEEAERYVNEKYNN